MRTPLFLCLVVLLASTGCKPEDCIESGICFDGTPLDDGHRPQPTPVDGGVATFQWRITNPNALPEQTSMLSLEALCVDEEGGFVFAAESEDIEGSDVNNVESIVLPIPYGQHETADHCFVLLRQNEQELPDQANPNPGRGTYTLRGVEHDAPVIAAGAFAGYWEVNLPPTMD